MVSGLITLAPHTLAQADVEYLASRMGEVSTVRDDLRTRWGAEIAVDDNGTDNPRGVWFDPSSQLRVA